MFVIARARLSDWIRVYLFMRLCVLLSACLFVCLCECDCLDSGLFISVTVWMHAIVSVCKNIYKNIYVYLYLYVFVLFGLCISKSARLVINACFFFVCVFIPIYVCETDSVRVCMHRSTTPYHYIHSYLYPSLTISPPLTRPSPPFAHFI